MIIIRWHDRTTKLKNTFAMLCNNVHVLYSPHFITVQKLIILIIISYISIFDRGFLISGCYGEVDVMVKDNNIES